MRCLILLILLICSTTCHAALTAIPDKNGRVALSGGTSSTWTKSAAGQPTVTLTATGTSVTDQRPNKHWKLIPYNDASVVYSGSWSNVTGGKSTSSAGATATLTFTGVAVGVKQDLYPEASMSPWVRSAFATYAVDGGAPATRGIDKESSNWTGGDTNPDRNVINWGTSGLSSASHTLVVTFTSGPEPLVIKGFYVNDFDVAMGTPITYYNNGQSVTVTPTIDYKAVIDHWCDVMVAYFPVGYSATTGGPDSTYEGLSALSAAYYITKRADVKAAMDNVLYAHTHSTYVNQTTGVVYPSPGASGTPYLHWTGRVPYNYYMAYRVLKNDYPADAANFLAVADTAAKLFVPRKTDGVVTWNGTTNKHLKTDASDDVIQNQGTVQMYSVALGYGLPESDLHNYANDSDILAAIRTNVEYQMQYYNPSTGFMPYSQYLQYQGSVYGMYQWQHLYGIWKHTGLYGPGDTGTFSTLNGTANRSEVLGKTADYIASHYSHQEPSLVGEYDDYEWAPNPETLYWMAAPLYYNNPSSITSAFRDLIYSAAFGGNGLSGSSYAAVGYDPLGADDVAWSPIQVDYRSFSISAIGLIDMGVPKNLWAYDTAATAAKSTATMRASFR